MRFEKRKKGPRKPCYIALAIFLAFPVSGFCQTVQQDLVGLGMPPEQADYLASIIPAGAALDNNVYLKGDNVAGSATINLIKLDTSDNTRINSSASDELILQLEDDGDRLVRFSAASDTALVMKYGTDSTPVAAQNLSMTGSTSDAADDAQIMIGGGGAIGSTRGASVDVAGNEHATLGGFVRLSAGNVSGAKVQLINNLAGGVIEFKPNGNTLVSTLDRSGLLTDDDSSAYTTSYVATPATDLTPVVAVSEMKPNTIIAAAGPTAQAIGIFGTPVAGQIKCVSNYSANPLIVASMGTPVVNGGTNRTTSVPTLRKLCCQVASASTTYDCLLDSAFTRPTPIGG